MDIVVWCPAINLWSFPMDFGPRQGARRVKAGRLRGMPRAGLNARNLLRAGDAGHSSAKATTSNAAFGPKDAEMTQGNRGTPHLSPAMREDLSSSPWGNSAASRRTGLTDATRVPEWGCSARCPDDRQKSAAAHWPSLPQLGGRRRGFVPCECDESRLVTAVTRVRGGLRRFSEAADRTINPAGRNLAADCAPMNAA